MFVVVLQVWISRIKRDPNKDFRISKSTKVCSTHFIESDFINSESQKKRLKPDACPSVFSWSKDVQKRSFPEKKRKLELEIEIAAAEETETASEGEGFFEETDCKEKVSRGVQVDVEVPCCHRFSVGTLRSKASTEAMQNEYFNHFTGFKGYEKFRQVLNFVLPGLDRSRLIYWNTKGANDRRIDTKILFDSDSDDDSDDTSSSSSQSIDECDVPVSRKHILPVEDEFLLVMMKLKLGLTNLDLAVRFSISKANVSTIFITWMNYLYVYFGKMKIWPHRDIIIDQMPSEYKAKYPNTVAIIDCTEIKIECPSSLLKQSQSYSNYKSTNTVKCLVGVDAKGGILFVSQLYSGLISDKEIVTRSGFLKLLKQKLEVREIVQNDAIMADKGFDIEEDLKKLGLQLNIPPFLGAEPSFSESDVIKTQTVAQHRIHVERAIGKVRKFLIFSSRIPVSMLGIINQVWSVSCMLTNFMEPILD